MAVLHEASPDTLAQAVRQKDIVPGDYAQMIRRFVTRRTLSLVLLLADAVLCAAIVARVSYTEIDWRAYMEQVAQVLNDDERDYAKIKGGTGPLVYPALHVYLYAALYKVTDEGRNIVLAQTLFAGLYLATLAVVMATLRRVKAPLSVFPLLVLSKRLHSIFLLRLFNDGLSAFLSSLSTYFYVRKIYSLGTLFFTLSVGVKMNALLYLPGIAMVLLQGLGVLAALRHALMMLQVQVLLAAPFLLHEPGHYVAGAFDLSRQFLYEWTVNWRSVSEATFLSRRFSAVLLAAHAAVLLLFMSTRWNRPSRRSLPDLVSTCLRTTLGALFPTGADVAMAEMTPAFILTTLWTSNLVGVLFARSLHYQFLAWFALTLPYLLHKTGLPFPVQLALWCANEWAWNVFPSTRESSLTAVAVPLVTLACLWQHTATDVIGVVLVDGKPSKSPRRLTKKKQQ